LMWRVLLRGFCSGGRRVWCGGVGGFGVRGGGCGVGALCGLRLGFVGWCCGRKVGGVVWVWWGFFLVGRGGVSREETGYGSDVRCGVPM